MAVFTIQSPDGRRIKIEAADEATAIRGAQEWAAANPPQASGPIDQGPNVKRLTGGVEPGSYQGSSHTPNVLDIAREPTMMDQVGAFGQGIADLPIVGPWVSDRLMDVQSGAASAISGRDYNDVRREADLMSEYYKERAGGSRLAGQIAGTVAATAPLGGVPVVGRALGMTGGLGSRVGFGAGSGMAITGADTLARGGTPDEAMQSALVGGALGGALPVVSAGLRRLVTPFPASAGRQLGVQTMQREGVDITAGQATGNRGLRFREAELGGAAAGDFTERQSQQFTAAALRRVGVNANRATHDVIDQAHTNIGNQFDAVAARNFIQPDRQMGQDLMAAWQRFEGSTNPSTRPRVIERIIRDIYQRGSTNPQIPGQWYKSTRSELGRLGKSANPELAEAARDLQHALDDAMERTLTQFNPADLGAWQEVRHLYRNMLVIEDAATRAGTQSAEGVITPSALRSAAMRHNKRAFARGRNDFTELADAGVSTMTPLPDSGTAGRLGAKLPMPLGAAAGASLGSAFGVPGAIGGALVGAALPPVLGRGMLSGPGRAYLGNQLMVPNPMRPSVLAPGALPALATQPR
jgi:hypothetical protein